MTIYGILLWVVLNKNKNKCIKKVCNTIVYRLRSLIWPKNNNTFMLVWAAEHISCISVGLLHSSFIFVKYQYTKQLKCLSRLIKYSVVLVIFSNI